LSTIAANYRAIRELLPGRVDIVVAAKARKPAEIAEVIGAGARIIGENYVQEAEKIQDALGKEAMQGVRFDMIGHLQRNKVNKALDTFDAIQSLDSLKIAAAIDKRFSGHAPLPVLVQVNVSGEASKYGILPHQLHLFLQNASKFHNISIKGLMTMEPYYSDPQLARPHFKKMQELFTAAKKWDVEGVEMETLSMGMSNSYKVAVEEGANMVRLGTAIFGPRK